MQLPEKLLESLQGIEGFDKEAFEKVHESGERVTSIRLNPSKLSIVNCQLSIGDSIHNSPFTIHNNSGPLSIEDSIHNSPFTIDNNIPWTQYGYYLQQRPSFTFDPLFHAGCYYVQEASSMFLEQALKQTVDLSKPVKILDLAAAPGGKSTHIQSLISKDSLLVSNEVIRNRSHVLKDNIIKWGCNNVVVTNNDPKDFARLENYFDVIVVDAPCSGSGLFRRDEEAIGEWSLNNVQLCSQRQQRILADVWPALKKEGILIYATCSYSKEEDEEIVKWMREELSIDNCQLTIDNRWGIVETDAGYRFWPDKVKGEGFFIACVRKTVGENEFNLRSKRKTESLNKKETELIKSWLNRADHLVKVQNRVYILPQKLYDDANIFLNNLYVIYFGTLVGEMAREKLIPDHAIALSGFISGNVERVNLDYEQAIAYLKKKDLKDLDIKTKGWKLACYKNYPLGWVNVLSNRINNYYPKELRILKDI